MAKQLVPNTAGFKVIQRFVVAGQPSVDFMNTFYVRNTISPWTVLHLEQTATAIGGAFTQLDDRQSSAVDRVEIQCEDLGADPGNQALVTLNSAGTRTGGPGPLSVCAVCTLIGGSGVAPRKGRVYISGLTEDQYEGNYMPANEVNAFQTDMNGLYDTALLSGDAFVIVSRYDDSYRTATNPRGLRPSGVTNTIESVVVRALVGSQRDRRV